MEAETKRRREKLIFLMIAGSISILLLCLGGFQLIEFSDSTAFCGRICHNVMNPEYTVHQVDQVSLHSGVTCATCHVGSGAGYLVKSKIAGIPMIVAATTGKYPRPIPVPVTNLRPARETCEQCHNPQKFSGDIVYSHTMFATDAANTKTVNTMSLRVGGGDAVTPQGIHWHIASTVWYLPMDDARQQIGWVGVQNADGTMTEFVDPKVKDQVTPQRIAADKRQMDCIDCHNRVGHNFESPNDLIDTAMVQGRIDSSLPFIKKEGLSVLDPVNNSLAVADKRIDGIKDYYRINYPQVYQDKGAAIDQAIAQLKEVAALTTFPDMNINWTTYPNNLGHMQSAGCFRCHGKLVESEGSQPGMALSADCTLCHYTPSN